MMDREELQNADVNMMIVRTIKLGWSDEVIGSVVVFKKGTNVLIFDIQIKDEVSSLVGYIDPEATKLPGEGSLLPQVYGCARRIKYDLRWDGKDWRVLYTHHNKKWMSK